MNEPPKYYVLTIGAIQIAINLSDDTALIKHEVSETQPITKKEAMDIIRLLANWI